MYTLHYTWQLESLRPRRLLLKRGTAGELAAEGSLSFGFKEAVVS